MKYVLRPAAKFATSPRLYDRHFPVTVTYKPGTSGTQPSREQVRSVPCGYCGAAADAHCLRLNGGERQQNHRDRVLTYKSEHAM